MKKYFRMSFLEEDPHGIGETVGEEEVILPYRGEVRGWKPILLDLREGAYPDYLASNLGRRLCSEKLKAILSDGASPDDKLQWLPLNVRDGRESRAYYLLHFPDPPDILDKRKTIFAAKDVVVKPVFLGKALEDHRVFTYRKNEGLPLFVVDEIKRELENKQCTGIDFLPVPVN